MAIYRIEFVATYTVKIEAESDTEARQKADDMAAMVKMKEPAEGWISAWNTMHRMDGADD